MTVGVFHKGPPTSMLYDAGEQKLTVIQILVEKRDKLRNDVKIRDCGGSSKQGVRHSNNVTGSTLTQTSFGLLTINVCMCVYVRMCVCPAKMLDSREYLKKQCFLRTSF